jgi:hypothetical protein
MSVTLKKTLYVFVVLAVLAGISYSIYSFVIKPASTGIVDNMPGDVSNDHGDSKEDDGINAGNKKDEDYTDIEKTIKNYSERTTTNEDLTADEGETTFENNAVNAFKAFYGYLASEDEYDKAFDMLHDDFKLKLDILKLFGTDYLVKSDIDINNAAFYSDIIKSAKLESIEQLLNTDKHSVISCIQSISIKDLSFKQVLETELIFEGKWKLISVTQRH